MGINFLLAIDANVNLCIFEGTKNKNMDKQVTVSQNAVEWALETLGSVILDSIENPHRKGECEGYRIAICLLPLWRELNPTDTQLDAVLNAALSVRNKKVQG